MGLGCEKGGELKGETVDVSVKIRGLAFQRKRN